MIIDLMEDYWVKNILGNEEYTRPLEIITENVLKLPKGILENQIAYEGLLNHLEAQPAVASNVSVFFCNEIETLMKTERQQEIPL